MTIKWNGDSATVVLNRLSQGRIGMSDGLDQANLARQALEDARPDGKNQMMNQLIAEYEATLTSLRASAQALDELVDSTRKARDQMDEAARRGDAMIDNLMTGTAGGATHAAAASQAVYASAARPYVVTPLTWHVPGRIIPDWLDGILQNTDL